ncbi:MAG: alkaline phosphatase D family protein [Pirellulaceae bacterium]
MIHNSRGLKLAVLVSVLLGSSMRVHAQHDYKVSRNLIRHGKLDEAVEVLIARMEKFPSDGEWVYQRSIALAQQGKLDESIKLLQTALRMDVPLGRVVADSHDLLEPLRKLDTFQKLLNRNGQQPTQGPMVGSVTSNSAKIWLRTASACTVQVIAMHDGAEACRGETMTHQEGDFTGVVKLAGLRADSEYTCTFVIDGETVKLPLTCRFRTLVPNGSPTKFRFAFGGGAGFVTGHEKMWQVIRDRKPDALLLLGDNMYSDDPQSSTMQKFCYYRRQSSLPYRKLVAMTTVYTIWDDHDFGTNDCSGGPDIDRPVWKIPVWNVFRQNWVNPAYGGGATQPGCWYDFQVGNIHFIMLDGRYYRHRPGKTMLGPVQKAWLKRTLLSSSAAIKVVASPVPWEYRTKGDSKDTWNGFRDERTEIFDFLSENKIDGVLLISADRHRSDAWKIDREDAYPLYEFNSSRLTNNHVHPTMKQAIFSYNKKQSFGLVELDTTPDDPKIDYSVWSIDGEKIHQLSLRYSQISETK